MIGIGNGKHSGRFPPKVYEIARKLSITNARKKAFSKCALMVLNNGKVKVGRERGRKREGEGGSEGVRGGGRGRRSSIVLTNLLL